MEALALEHTVAGLRSTLHHFKEANVEYDVYLARMRRTKPSKWNLACRIFSWVTHALRPLTVEELGCALAIEDGMISIDTSERVSEDAILQASGGLVTAREEWRGVYERVMQFDRVLSLVPSNH
jgi:hypothetical protein